MTYLKVGPALLEVDCEATAPRSYSRPSSMLESLDGTRTAVQAPRVMQDWTLTFDLSTPEKLGILRALVHGEFGRGPFRLVDSWAVVTNVLSAGVSLLEHFVGSSMATVSGYALTEDGGWVGRSLTGTQPVVTLTPGGDFAAVAPPAGTPVTVSAYAVAGSGTTARIRPIWFTQDGSQAAGPLVTRPAAGPRLSRIHASTTVPATVTVNGASVPVHGVGLAVWDAARVARPAVTWTSELMEWGVGEAPRWVVLDPPQVDPVTAWRTQGGRHARVQITAREVGP